MRYHEGMKKAILILIAGLLWCNVGFARSDLGKYDSRHYSGKQAESEGKIFIGQTKASFCDNNWTSTWAGESLCDYSAEESTNPNLYYYKNNYEILASADNRFYLFKNVYNPMTTCEGMFSGNYKKCSGQLISIYNSIKDAINGIQSGAEKPENKEPKTTEPSPDDKKVVAAASGSGFFVSKTGHIVTNHHVIDECKAVKVNFKGDEIEAKILAIDKTNDLAILKAKINPSKVFAVSNEDVTLLQDVIVAGFPLGKKVSAAIKTHKGSVSALAGFGDNYSNFQTDATINQGNSGGPVMDEKGNIVGVAVALMSAEAGQNIFFAVKSSTLKTFANANGITFLPPNNREMSNAELGQLITEGTLFLGCWMTIAKIKQIIAQEENRKAFYSEFK